MTLFLEKPNTTELKAFYQKLMIWFDEHGRHDLPWKPQDKYSKAQNIYHIWLSEIMLQQTQVATVIPYFFNFIEKFPTTIDLANASPEDVSKAWEGLGYYARARNLHTGAKTITDNWQGTIPESFEAIQSIKGIGRTTASAIMSQGFNRPFAILDGNVKRVLARILGATHGEKQLEKVLLPFAYLLSNQARPNDYTQAIMDFGATICSKSPKCDQCFWQSNCITLKHQKIDEIPAKKVKLIKKDIELHPVIIQNQKGELIFHQRTEESIWHNLYEFPHLSSQLMDIEDLLNRQNIEIKNTQELPSFKHILTHINYEIHPIWVSVYSEQPSLTFEDKTYHWVDRKTYLKYAKTKPTNDLLVVIAT